MYVAVIDKALRGQKVNWIFYCIKLSYVKMKPTDLK